jgi:signal transduction histidine kinase
VRLWIEGEDNVDLAASRRELEDGGRRPGAANGGVRLAVARATACRVGGDLRLVETPDEGFRFELEMPAARSEES